MLRGRCMICRKVKIVPIECVVRGWLAGSAHTEYKKKRPRVRRGVARGLATMGQTS